MRRPHVLPALGVAGTAAALALAGCGGSGSAPASTQTRTVKQTTVQVVAHRGDPTQGFDAAAIYRDAAPGVVTVISVLDKGAAQGSGFVLNGKGEIATNAHVVTSGQGGSLETAKQVYVKFADGNQVPAKVVGADPNADVALLKVDPAGLTLRPLPLGHTDEIVVGAPVAAIGSPFGEPQSLSTGVVSGTDRSIDSLTKFQIDGAIQTDAAINHGNSGGPLVNAKGQVIGINSQIESSGGGNEGVGFAVPIDAVRRSLDQLRADGQAEYAYLGVSTLPMYPQLAADLHLKTDDGAFVQSVVPDGPADKAGIRSSGPKIRFQAQTYCSGGDVITAVGKAAVHDSSDLSSALSHYGPGDRVAMRLAHRDAAPRTVHVTLGERPDGTANTASTTGC